MNKIYKVCFLLIFFIANRVRTVRGSGEPKIKRVNNTRM